MRNITVKLLVLSVAMGSCFIAQAQTAEQKAEIIKSYDLEEVTKLKAELKAKYEANIKRAYELAEINGWPLTIEDEERGTIILTGVSANDKPIYTANRNDGPTGSAHTARVTALRAGGSLNVNLKGQGMMVGMWEVGYPRKTHVELTGRISDGGLTDNGSFQSNQADTDIAMHATHVAGTLIGSGSNDPLARGIAYGANLRAYNALNDESEGFNEAVTNAMLVSNHSYGMPWEAAVAEPWLKGAYIEEARDWDDITFNAPYWQPVFAAGNDRLKNTNAQRDDLLGNSNSKNPIIVAAVYALPQSGYFNHLSVSIAEFSSFGPTNDRRIKPDISAKGMEVYSCSSEGNTDHYTNQGTSMASPAVAGVLLLLQEYYESLNENQFMKAATVKGLVLNTADEAGDHPGPDYKFGWGLINAERAAQLIKVRNQQSIIAEETLTQGGQPFTKQIKAMGGGKTLKATICWTDRPGPAASGTTTNPVLVNNLNMRIIKDGEEYLPWKLNPNNIGGAAIKGINNVDNVETVEIPDASGIYTIEITNGGAPLIGGLQNFSLIVDGVTDVMGIAENELSSKIGIYPNPATDVVNIAFDNTLDTSNVTIALYDIQGRIISNYNSFVERIDVSDLSTGIYMLNITKDGAVASKKIIIE